MTLNRRRHASAVSCVAAYGPTESTPDDGRKHSVSTALYGAVKQHFKYKQLFVLIIVKERSGRRGRGGLGSEYCRVHGA